LEEPETYVGSVEMDDAVKCLGPAEMDDEAKSVGLVEREILRPIERDFES
jgi:hypothetical protein